MATPIIMPKQGQSVESCVIQEWKKKKGDQVKQGEVVFSYETDKASFEFESPADGTVLELFFNEGDDVPVLTNVGVLGNPGESFDELKPGTAAAEAPAAPSELPAESPVTAAPVPTPAAAPSIAPSVVSAVSTGAASPRARKRAGERGVDLSSLAGTGPHGRVIERDVLAAPAMTSTAVARSAAEGLAAPVSGTGIGGRIRAADLVAGGAVRAATTEDVVTEVPLTKIRKIIADRMMQSLQQTAQLTMNSYADATAMLAFRKKLKAKSKDLALPDITITDLIALAVAKTLPRHPDLNCIFSNDKLYRYDHVHLAMAVDTPRGLMVPVVRFADTLGLGELSGSLKSLVGQCREGSISPDLLSGGTITISNLGTFGVDSFTPILNPPQVAILGVDAISPRPIAREDGGYELRPHIGFSLTVDHRVVDGAPGARFLKELCENIANIDFMVAVW